MNENFGSTAYIWYSVLNVFVTSFRADVLARGDAGESVGTGGSVRAFRALRPTLLSEGEESGVGGSGY